VVSVRQLSEDSHSSQASAIVALSDCNLSKAFLLAVATALFIYLSILNLFVDM